MNYIYPANVCFECNNCGLCCGDTENKRRHILLLKSEVEEISIVTGQRIEEFTIDSVGTTPYVYEMKKLEGKCVFLRDNLCSIYAVRPLICQFYPFELKYEADRKIHVFSDTSECPMIGWGKKLTKENFEALYTLAQQRLL
ncbi:MAG: YkgJ family cysteine cluster protein [Crenarchaeota archaeon]|nr:YkgJ family cysteine cluster protein [Thermoproteota archaeon]